MDEPFARADRVEDRGARVEGGRALERRPFQRGPVEVRQFLERGEIDQAVRGVDVALVERDHAVLDLVLQLPEQPGPHGGRHALLDLEADHLAEGAAAHLVLDRAQHVRRVGVERDLRAARGAERVRAHQLEARIQSRQLRLDHVLDTDIAAALGQRQEARQVSRELDGDEVLRRIAGQPHDGGEGRPQVAHVRERVRRVGHDGREQRLEPRAERRVQPLAFAVVEFGPAHEPDAVRFERRDQRFPQQRIRAPHHRPRTDADRVELGRGRQTVRCAAFPALRDGRLEAGHARGEEVVAARAEHGEEADALEQRRGRVLRDVEHALIEGEATELGVEQQLVRHVLGARPGGLGLLETAQQVIDRLDARMHAVPGRRHRSV